MRWESPYVGLVGCGKAKGTRSQAARQVYRGALTVSSARWAAQNFRDWYFVSARYGLVHTEETLSPYEDSLLSKSESGVAAWADRLRAQLADKFPGGRCYVCLAGPEYIRALLPPGGSWILSVFTGQMDIVNRQRWLVSHPRLTAAVLDDIFKRNGRERINWTHA